MKRPDLKQSWAGYPPSSKVQFLLDNADKVGDDFARNYERQVVHTSRALKRSDFDATGEFKDIQDVKELYKNKPDVRDWILANAQTIEAQGQTLYECLTFKSLKKDREDNIEEQVDKVSQ